MYVDGPTQTILLQAADPFQIRDIVPKSRLVEHADYNIAVHHSIASAKVLRNLGFDVPAPIGAQYHWPGKYRPYAHQKTMAEFMTLHRRCFNLSEMGTMKTAATLWAADWLMTKGIVHKVLIISPLSTLETVWLDGIFDTLMHRRAAVVHGSREKRLELLNHDFDFYILNHDGVTIKPVHDFLRKNPEIDLVIVDEGSMFRNASTQKHKDLEKMLRPDQWLWWLTGTPCPNAPTDAWAQAKLVAPNKVPKHFGTFKRETMTQITRFKWVPRAESYARAYDVLQPAVRFKKKDCIDLPPMTFTSRQSGLTEEQKKAFSTMKTLMVAEAKKHTITAVHAADKLIKLQQILCGAVKDPETDTYITLPHAPRLAVLKEVIEQAAAKVIVIVPFKGITHALEHELRKDWTVGVLNGDVSRGARDTIIRNFKTTKEPHILLCHPKVMAHGLNLTEADVLVFYAPIYSNDEYQQVIERINRAGQVNPMTIVKIGAHPMEWDIYKQLDNKALTQDNILKLYKSITE